MLYKKNDDRSEPKATQIGLQILYINTIVSKW